MILHQEVVQGALGQQGGDFMTMFVVFVIGVVVGVTGVIGWAVISADHKDNEL